MDTLRIEQEKFAKHASLAKSLDEVQKTVDRLIQTRDAIASNQGPIQSALPQLQLSMKQTFDHLGAHADEISSAQKKYRKALDKHFKAAPLETSGYDALASRPALINRAIAMHLLREGQFSVASDFLAETAAKPPNPPSNMNTPYPSKAFSADANAGSISPESLQAQFTEMYHILDDMKKSFNLIPAIAWAKQHRQELESRGSNLEFELNKLQFIWLYKGNEVSEGPNYGNMRVYQALSYAQQHFGYFQEKHQREIQQLAAGLAFATNITHSPYQMIFDDVKLREEVADSFTKEFCSLLGLSSDSPLFISTTAGAIALPHLLKLATIMKAKRTEWTTQDELPVEIPLPPSYHFHSIFVCPVSKEQSTEENPPMMLPCGHVIAQESLARLGKGARFKCPYCPRESYPREAKRVYL